MNLYLVPIEASGIVRGPKYFKFGFGGSHAGIDCRWWMMDYGFTPYALVAAETTPADHAALIANADVYAFPANLDAPVSDPAIDGFFEGINLPTDWLTPATTYRELLRQTAGMFQLNQRYGGIYADRYGGLHSIFDTATLQTRLNQMTAAEREVFLATVESFGFNPALVPSNARLRQLVKAAGDYWVDKSFVMGEYTF